ncbi:MAG: TIGR03936 family radical SAM-associated protein [Peptococcaceae bacterium]
MHLRIKYGKNKRGRFISHLDLARAWERALRRAQIPLSYSQGFNPHPRISFGSALAVGITSSGEYLDIVLKNNLSIKEIKAQLEKYLPAGLEIFDITEITDKAPSLMSIINRAQYTIEVTAAEPVKDDYLHKLIRQLLNQEKIMVLRDTKKGCKEKDIKDGIFKIEGQLLAGNKIQLNLILQTGSEGNVRPEEILQALKNTGLQPDLEIINIHREGLFVGDGTHLISPLSVTS